MAGAEQKGRLGRDRAHALVPLVRPEARALHAEAHDHAVEPEVVEELLQARLGLCDHRHAPHECGQHGDQDTEVTRARRSLQQCEK